MRLLIIFAFALALALALAGCEEATGEYSYTPPQTAGGRMCTNQCRIAHDYCLESCDLPYRSCVANLQGQALKDYDKYTREQFAANQPMDLYISDFERPQACTDRRDRCDGACENTYNVCYGSCGGVIAPAESCPLYVCF